MTCYDRPPFASGIALDLDSDQDGGASRLVADYDVRTTSVQTPAGTLSGGNQQKVIVARELSRDNKLLLASQPTRGLDVGSIEFVHKQIVAQRDRGVAVVIVSSELDEIYALSDRIAVMYEGQIVGFCAPDIPEAELGLMMAGAGAPAPATREGRTAAASQPGTTWPELPGTLSTARSPSGPVPPATARSRAVSDELAPADRPAEPGRTSRAAEQPGAGRAAGQEPRQADRRGDHRGHRSGQPGRDHDPGDLPGASRRRPADRVQRPGRDCTPGATSSPPLGTRSAQTWNSVVDRVLALFEGAIFSPATISAAFHGGSIAAIFYPLSLTAFEATPLILTGLSVAIAFRAGLFNIGAAGQFVGGAMRRGLARLRASTCRPASTSSSACSARFVGGAVLGWIVGELKARTGAHEVIVTIMLNYVMYNLLNYLLSASSLLQQPDQSNQIAPPIDTNAVFPHVGGPPPQANVGFLIALAAAAGGRLAADAAARSGSSSARSAPTRARHAARA